MKLISTSLYQEKSSKFYSSLYKLNTFEEYKLILEIHKKEYKKANHHCFAVIFRSDTKITNDSEVGSPGRIIFNFLEKHTLNSHILITSRIFGGTKLGVGGVARAFRKSISKIELK
jgi:putative IMPACT (imprinted ancient) family translation regulator